MDKLEEQYPILEIFIEWYINVLEEDFEKNDYPQDLLKDKIEDFLVGLNELYQVDSDIYFRAETLLSRLEKRKADG